ncbi:glycosyltransferase family 2 protein [Streptomyces sp. NPDC059142]|uniref:glycosyltransferase family 2 protein n=1 Tax=Streptomyces sp. NPDC059142 TaxID=3346739 RepID=UPI0036C3080A
MPVPGPVAVAELDLRAADGTVLSLRPAPGGPPVGEGEVFALVRIDGRPVATVTRRVAAGQEPAEALAAAFRAQHRATPTLPWMPPPAPPPTPPPSSAFFPPSSPSLAPPPSESGPSSSSPFSSGPSSSRLSSSFFPPARSSVRPLRTTVIVATRERADRLARALDSLLAQDHPDFRVLVVDNAPATTATRDLVASRYADRVDYAHEPRPGLAVAHNRGIAVADRAVPVLAFTDDDVIADPHWLSALTAPFTADPRLGCTTGLILPARLTTPAQILLESHGGFAKGFAPRLYDPAAPPAGEPLFPFAAGSFGSGANMAFRAGVLRAVGGFDPATGTGTPAKGGDDLYAFVRVLAAGHRLRYTPEALVWHHHRETWQDLRNQAYGYGAGLTAYLTAILVRQPALLPALLAKAGRGLAHARAITAHGAQTYPWPRSLSRLERRGMLYGPLGYARARIRARGAEGGGTP